MSIAPAHEAHDLLSNASALKQRAEGLGKAEYAAFLNDYSDTFRTIETSIGAIDSAYTLLKHQIQEAKDLQETIEKDTVEQTKSHEDIETEIRVWNVKHKSLTEAKFNLTTKGSLLTSTLRNIPFAYRASYDEAVQNLRRVEQTQQASAVPVSQPQNQSQSVTQDERDFEINIDFDALPLPNIPFLNDIEQTQGGVPEVKEEQRSKKRHRDNLPTQTSEKSHRTESQYNLKLWRYLNSKYGTLTVDSVSIEYYVLRQSDALRNVLFELCKNHKYRDTVADLLVELRKILGDRSLEVLNYVTGLWTANHQENVRPGYLQADLAKFRSSAGL